MEDLPRRVGWHGAMTADSLSLRERAGVRELCAAEVGSFRLSDFDERRNRF